MADKDYIIPDKSASDVYTEEMWDNQKEVINANRVKRNIVIQTLGSITYNETNLVTWSNVIWIYFLDDGDDLIYNEIDLTPNTVASGDYQILYVKLVNTNAYNINMNSIAYASFDRAGLGSDTGDIIVIGMTDDTEFLPVGWMPRAYQSHLDSVSDPHSVTKTQVGLGSVDNVADGDQTSLGTLASGDVRARDTIGLISSKVSGDIFYYTTVLTRLAKGSNGQVLTLTSGLPSWVSGGAGTSFSYLNPIYSTAQTSGTLNWAKILRIDIATRYDYFSGYIHIIGRGGGGSAAKTPRAVIYLQVYQQDALGSATFIRLDLISSQGYVASDFKVGYTTASNIVDLFIHSFQIWVTYDFLPIYTASAGIVTWYDNATWGSFSGTELIARSPAIYGHTLSKSRILFYDDFSNYDDNDEIHGSVEHNNQGVAGNSHSKAVSTPVYSGTRSWGMWYGGSSSGLGYWQWRTGFNIPVTDTFKISYWFRQGDSNGNSSNRYWYGQFWDNSAGVYNQGIIAGFSRTGTALKCYANGAFQTFKTMNINTWYFMEIWIRTRDLANTNRVEIVYRLGGTRYPGSGWSAINTSTYGASDYFTMITYYYVHYYWVRQEYIDELKVESYDGSITP